VREVSARAFIDAFDEAVSALAERIAATWDKPLAIYTETFLDSEGILQKVANILELTYKRGFLTTDAAFFDDGMPVVAIEHENIITGIAGEARRLAALNVKLKVLISYPKNSHDDPVWQLEYLRVLESRLSDVSQHLLIFASEDPNINWRYFVPRIILQRWTPTPDA
jgi:hypothetical protein